MELLKWTGVGFAALTAVGGGITGLWQVGDSIGYRPAWKWELEQSGWFNRRLYLRDKIEAGTATPRDIGEFCGLSLVLKQPLKAECS